MKESSFIKNNLKKWRSFEKLEGDKSHAKIDEEAKLFGEIIDDLNYSRTFFNKRSVRIYLNNLSFSVFTKLTTNQHREAGVANFWLNILPKEVYRSYKQILTALAIFLIAMGIGAVSQDANHEFANLIMGDYYMEMTEENIANGDPFAVYKTNDFPEFFYQLITNNTRVAIIAFIGGLLLGLGTFYILIHNGIMLGTFQMYLYQKGLFVSSLGAVWLHGVFEISAIVISGAAGFVLANGIVNPGSYTRSRAFINGAKRGSRIMLSMIPFLVVAGFIESAVTPNYDALSVGPRVILLILCTSIIIFYIVILPIRARHYKISSDTEQNIKLVSDEKWTLFKVRGFSDLFNESLNVFKNLIDNLGRRYFGLLSLGILCFVFGIVSMPDFFLMWFENIRNFRAIDVFSFSTLELGLLPVAIFWGIYTCLLNIIVNQQLNIKKWNLQSILVNFLFSFMGAIIFLYGGPWWILISLTLSPLAYSAYNGFWVKNRFKKQVPLNTSGSVARNYQFYLGILFFGILATFGINLLFASYLDSLFDDHLIHFTESHEALSRSIKYIVLFVMISVAYTFIIIFNRLNYFSGYELEEGKSFEKSIVNFGR